MNIIQNRADKSGQTAVLTVTAAPRDEQYYTSNTPRKPAQGNKPAGYLAPGQQGPRTRNQSNQSVGGSLSVAQQRAANGKSTKPAGYLAAGQQGPQMRPASSQRSQPPLAQVAADKIRQQYAAATQGAGGSFMTDTNTGLQGVLQGMGIQPRPVEQWPQVRATQLALWGDYLKKLQEWEAMGNLAAPRPVLQTYRE